MHGEELWQSLPRDDPSTHSPDADISHTMVACPYDPQHEVMARNLVSHLVHRHGEVLAGLAKPPCGKARTYLQHGLSRTHPACFSADGLTLIAGSTRRAVQIVDCLTASVREVRHPSSPQGQGPGPGALLFPSVCISADGSTIASGMEAKVFIWNCVSGELVNTLDHPLDVSAVELSADGRSVVSAAVDGTLRVFGCLAGNLTRKLTAHTGAVRFLKLSRQGHVAVSGLSRTDRTVRIWDWRAGTARHTLDVDANALCLSADGGTLACAQPRSTAIGVWDCVTGAWRQEIDVPKGGLRTLSLSADGGTVACGWRDMIRVWDLSTGRLIPQVMGRQVKPPEWVHIAAPGLHIAADGTVLWMCLDGLQTWAAAVGPAGAPPTSSADGGAGVGKLEEGRSGMPRVGVPWGVSRGAVPWVGCWGCAVGSGRGFAMHRALQSSTSRGATIRATGDDPARVEAVPRCVWNGGALLHLQVFCVSNLFFRPDEGGAERPKHVVSERDTLIASAAAHMGVRCAAAVICGIIVAPGSCGMVGHCLHLEGHPPPPRVACT